MAEAKKAKTVGGKPVKAKAPAKPKNVTILTTELEPLQEADSILRKIEATEAECEQKAIVVEGAKEELKLVKGAYDDAVLRLRRLCRIRKEKHPLFDKPKDEAKANATADKKQAATGLPKVKISAGDKQHGIALGTMVTVDWLKPGGLVVSGGGVEQMLIEDAEYTCDTTTAALIADARVAKVIGDGDAWAKFIKDKSPKPAVNPAIAKNGWRTLPLSDAGINGNVGKLLTEAGYDTLGKLAELMNKHGQWWNKEVKGVGETGATEVADRFADFWASHPEYCQ